MSVIIAAAGAGRRMGGVSKAFLRLGRSSVLTHSLRAFAAMPETHEIILVLGSGDIAAKSDWLKHAGKRYRALKIVRGGKLRQESVANGLECVTGTADLIAVHDAARPLVTTGLIRRVIRAALETGAAIPAAPAKDTLKRSGKTMFVKETVSRDGLWHVQTPQIFDAKLLRRAYEKYADTREFTDDAQLIERMGRAVAIVKSDHTNIKITTPGDLAVARAIARAIQIKPKGVKPL